MRFQKKSISIKIQQIRSFLTKEYSFDAKIIGEMLYEDLKEKGCNF